MQSHPDWTVFANGDLVPPSWRGIADSAQVWCFNPALVRVARGWLMVYRVVLRDQRRRIAACLLDRNFGVVEGSHVAVSDHIRFAQTSKYPERATSWFADPRVYDFDGQLLLYFNSGWHEPCNHQFIVALDPVTYTPAGPACELMLVRPRGPLEKNWVFLPEGIGKLVYSPSPHRIATLVHREPAQLLFELVDDKGSTVPSRGWQGQLRGGAPPLLHNGVLYSFCHIITDSGETIRYHAGVYRFCATPPYAPLPGGAALLELPSPPEARRAQPKLNPAVDDVIYPCGAARLDHSWIVSCGLNDEHCAILTMPDDYPDSLLTPKIGDIGQSGVHTD
jgi:hypothetical protein